MLELAPSATPRSLLLGSLALAWALLVGLPAGVLAALRANSWPDYVLTAFASVCLALPNFLVGTLLIYLVSVRLGLLPTSGWGTWKHMLMPSLALGLMPLGYIIRIVRGTMLETLTQDYVRAARAKGLTRGRPANVEKARCWTPSRSTVAAWTALRICTWLSVRHSLAAAA